MMNNDLVYLHRRADEERSAAMNCASSEARGIHLELAEQYEFHVFLLEQLAVLKTNPGFAGDASERAGPATAQDP
jgi:hypothetical protein